MIDPCLVEKHYGGDFKWDERELSTNFYLTHRKIENVYPL